MWSTKTEFCFKLSIFKILNIVKKYIVIYLNNNLNIVKKRPHDKQSEDWKTESLICLVYSILLWLCKNKATSLKQNLLKPTAMLNFDKTLYITYSKVSIVNTYLGFITWFWKIINWCYVNNHILCVLVTYTVRTPP